MPNLPLPKPAIPIPKPAAPSISGIPGVGGMTGSSLQPGKPPTSQLRPTPTALGMSRSNSPVVSSVPSMPQASMPGKQPMTAAGPIPIARPGSPLPMQSAQLNLGVGGTNLTNTAPPALPGAPTMPGAPAPKIATPSAPQPPPRTLSALQSMSSTNLPTSATQPGASPPPAKTNLAPGYGIAPLAPPAAGTTDKDGKGKDTNKPEFAAPQKSIFRFLPFILGGVLLLAVAGFMAFKFFGSSQTTSIKTSSTGADRSAAGANPTTPAPSVVLEYWGLWEPTETMTEVIKAYEQQNPGVSINYTKQSSQDYRVRLQTALVQGENGPDIFRYHASWVPIFKAELSVLPSSIMTSADYQSTFYPAASQMLNVNGQLVGIPLMYEGLALFYNTEIFSTAVLEPPKTWPDLRTVASKLTVKAGNSIKRAGIAMGTAGNVEHFSDILAVLMMQNKADLLNPNSPETSDALKFYVNFSKADDVWDETLPASSVAFARGDVAMIFAPSWRALEIKQMNPNLPFKTVPMPQLDDTRIASANFWAEGVSSKSQNKDAAWKFLKYLSSAEVQKKLYATQSGIRPFGEMYSRKDLANELAADPVASAFLQDAPFAKGSYMSSATHDGGLNDQIVKYYEDAVTALNGGSSVEEVLITLDQGVKQTLRQYGIEPGTTTQ